MSDLSSNISMMDPNRHKVFSGYRRKSLKCWLAGIWRAIRETKEWHPGLVGPRSLDELAELIKKEGTQTGK